MGLLDTILGRSKPVPANLDALFALPSASVTLQSAAGQVCSGHAGVCFKPPSGQAFGQMQQEVDALLAMDSASGFERSQDSFGYQWLVVADPDIEALVTHIHLVNSSLSDSGWGAQLLCSVFGVADEAAGGAGSSGGASPDGDGAPGTDLAAVGSAGPGRLLPSSAYLVYLFKRGTFYPFIPTGKEQRDLEGELRLKSLVADDLKVEPDLDRWFPLWDLPVG